MGGAEVAYYNNPFQHQSLERSLDCWRVVDGLFSGEEVEDIIKIGEGCKQDSGQVIYKNKLNFIVRRSKVAWVGSSEMKPVYDKVWDALAGLNRLHWGFEIDSLQNAQYSTYGPLCHYFYHMDIGTKEGTGERKLSVSINLTDPAEFIGGKLRVIGGGANEKYPSQSLGAMIAFPSYLMHRVSPVWWGTRRSLVFWATGKPFS